MESMDNLKLIYGRLSDEQSRFIFQNRLLYSISGDEQAIRKMVAGEMKRYGNSDIVNHLINWIQLRGQETVVFGAGFASCQIVTTLRYFGILVRYLVDNNPNLWGTARYGITVISLKELLRLGKMYSIVIGVNDFADEIYNQLLKNGIDRGNIYFPEKKWWLGNSPQYFDSRIMTPGEHEVFIDGGALDGGDSIQFITWCKNHYDKIYAFEPDESNYKKLAAMKETKRNFFSHQEGLWSRETELSFSSGGKECSHIAEDGNTKIKVVSIDGVLKGQPATLMKMDVEGSELEALCGAEKTIKKYKPRLVVCVYHKMEDIIAIPLKILELNPEYQLYLRHYSYVDTETVLYAI